MFPDVSRLLRVFLVALCCLSVAGVARAEGQIDYNPVNHSYAFFDGSAWYGFSIGALGLACVQDARLEYDHLLSTYRYCNGAAWVLIIGTPILSFCSGAGKREYFNSSYYFCNGLVWVNMKGSIV